MPELPEVETVRRGVEAAALGQVIQAVRVKRRDVVQGRPQAMAGHRLSAALRHGKQLALVTDAGPLACVHLGMSGSLCVEPASTPRAKHTHLVWVLANGQELRFRDPRRFGGVACFADRQALHKVRWHALGPDATTITPADLHRRLNATRRVLKAALLDQNLVAGLGNIYVDELLFAARLSPLMPGCAVDRSQAKRLVARMRPLLARAVKAGGSSLRDYVGADGASGAFQNNHQVYGRGGLPCPRCGQDLSAMAIAQRTSVWCGGCQSVDTTQELGD